MDETQLWLEVLLKKHYKNNTISKVISIDSKPATSKGDNYTSILKRITIDVILSSGKRIKKSVIIKELPTTMYTKIIWDNMGLFLKEIEMYRSVLPHLEDLMNEYNDFTEPMWGKCLEFRPYDRLVFEDLLKFGYKMSDRKQGLDFQHCQLVLQSLSKLHAASVIIKQRGPINMEIFGKHMYQKENLSEILENFHAESFKKLIVAMENSWEPEWKPIAEKLQTEVVPNAAKILSDLTVLDEKKFNVLNHGDCWVNNMLFKYGLDDVTPISVKFVDFQLSVYNSPAFDLKYFLCTSPSIDVRKNSIQKLIDIYHQTLVKELKFYNYDGDIITIDTLNDELKRINFYGLLVTITVLAIVTLEDVESFPDLEEIFKDAANGVKIESKFNPFLKVNSNFVSIVKDVIKSYVN